MMENVLQLDSVNKRFKDFALDGVAFALPKGFIMGFVGQNGAGKTTTIKLILNMLKRDGGEIRVFGEDNIKRETAIKEKIGVVMDSPFYVDGWTVAQTGRALKPFYSHWDDAKYKKLLAGFSLSEKKKVKDLSRGMKMKLMIACALSHNAELLILDEPTSGLDAVARDELMDILKSFISDENKSVLFSTHITSDLEKIADYITFINSGKILYSGTKDDLMEKYTVVKGGLGILSAEQKKLITGYREHNVGFDGIVEAVKVKELPKEIITESCSLDDLVIRFNIGGGK
jgi:ABC-2 type transport system ATP-binding protein